MRCGIAACNLAQARAGMIGARTFVAFGYRRLLRFMQLSGLQPSCRTAHFAISDNWHKQVAPVRRGLPREVERMHSVDRSVRLH